MPLTLHPALFWPRLVVPRTPVFDQSFVGGYPIKSYVEKGRWFPPIFGIRRRVQVFLIRGAIVPPPLRHYARVVVRASQGRPRRVGMGHSRGVPFLC